MRDKKKLREGVDEMLGELEESRKIIDLAIKEIDETEGRITKGLDETKKRHARELDELGVLKKRVEEQRERMTLARTVNVNGVAEAKRNLEVLDSMTQEEP